jgi:hypothetical protein
MSAYGTIDTLNKVGSVKIRRWLDAIARFQRLVIYTIIRYYADFSRFRQLFRSR